MNKVLRLIWYKDITVYKKGHSIKCGLYFVNCLSKKNKELSE